MGSANTGNDSDIDDMFERRVDEMYRAVGVEQASAGSGTALRDMNDAQSALFEAKAKEIDAIHRRLAERMVKFMLDAEWKPQQALMSPETFSDLERSLRGEPFYGPGIPEILAREGATPLTPAVVVTLATLGAFEWLRHRKAEVAAAEASGDYTTLIQEFVTWLRGLLQAWREAASK